MTTWRYVAAYERIADEDIWTIRELYVDDGEKLSWSVDPYAPQGSNLIELMDDVSRMNEAVCAAQFLDLMLNPAALVQRERRGR